MALEDGEKGENMPKDMETSEPRTNLVLIRQSYFSRSFWKFWEGLRERPKAAYLLGWITELESAVRALSERVRRVEEEGEDREP